MSRHLPHYELILTIWEEFKKRGYRWKIGGNLVEPTEEDIRKTLDRMRELLYTEPIGAQMELGRLIMKKWDTNKYDVYILLGEFNEESS